MTTTTTINPSPDELSAMIRQSVRDEMQARFDRPVTRKEVASLWGVSIQTVDRHIKRGVIRRINPDGGHARFSMNEVMNCNKRKL